MRQICAHQRQYIAQHFRHITCTGAYVRYGKINLQGIHYYNGIFKWGIFFPYYENSRRVVKERETS